MWSTEDFFRLSDAQRDRLTRVIDGWIDYALRDAAPIDAAAARRGIDFLYGCARLSPPQHVVVAKGPRDCLRTARLHRRLGLCAPPPANNAAIYRAVEDRVRHRSPLAWERSHLSGVPALERARRVVTQVVNLSLWPDGLAPDTHLSGLGLVAFPWSCYYDFLRSLGLVGGESVDRWLDFLRCGVWDCCLTPDVALLCPPPARLRRDEAGRLHDTIGPAIAWEDGTCAHFVHGIPVPAAYVEEPDSIPLQDVLRERNVEVRRTLLDLVGMQRFVAKACPQVLDRDADRAGMPRRLLRIAVPPDEPYTLVEVTCPSTGHLHYLRVPPDVTRCSEAVAWTFGFEVGDYLPMVEA